MGTTAKTDELRDLGYLPEGGPRDAYREERARLDLHVPEGAQGFATVVWFHGGGLTGGRKGVPESLKGKGYAVASPEYRLSPRAKAPAHAEDAAAAVAWVFRNIAGYGGDPGRIVLAGHSAGAYLAGLVALDKGLLAAHGVDADRVAAVFALSGPATTPAAIREERGLPKLAAVVDGSALLAHVRPDAPPFHIVTGDRELERHGRYEENALLGRLLKDAGHPAVTLRELKGLDHFSLFEPSVPLILELLRSVSAAA